MQHFGGRDSKSERELMASVRYDRINEEIKKALSEIVREMKDPRISPMTTIMLVEATNDLKLAKVRVSVYDKDDSVRKETVAQLNRADKTSGQLCIFIGKNLSLQPLTEAPKRVRNLRFRPKEAEPNSFGDCRIRKMKREIPDIALTLTPGIGPKGAVHLLDVFGSAEAVFSASADELIEKARLRPELARAILQKKAFADAEREVKHCRKHGIEIIASTDAQYPALLRETADYPHVLYVLGSPEALGKTTLTMVGTRRMTPYGQQMADRLIGELADRVADTVIVSGLAFGIDTACHRAALAFGMPTVGIIASALPGITPAQHTAVARDMIEHGGAVVSELHSQTRQNAAAMNYWAILEYQLCYKNEKKGAERIRKELKECAIDIAKIDKKMLKLRKEIEKI